VQAPTRTAISGPALVRLLARYADSDVPAPASALADRLSQWLGWTDAIALSTALASVPPAGGGASPELAAEEQASQRTRAALTRDVLHDERAEAARRGRHRMPAQAVADAPPPDFAVYRHRYQSLQQTMEADVGALRTRLRAALAAQSPAKNRLAVVDAVMEQALAARERSALTQVPALLGRHFERLRRAHAADEGAPSHTWLDAFRKDMQSVLLAELDVRFQPVEGLLAALRTR
jgi:hypothetical protein